MFDMAFSEMVVIGVVALIVIGPEKLPKVARTVGILLGRAQRYVGDIKSDINRQIQLDELKKLQEQVETQARELESSVRKEAHSVESSFNDTVQALTQSVQATEPAQAESTAATDTAAASGTAEATPAAVESSPPASAATAEVELYMGEPPIKPGPPTPFVPATEKAALASTPASSAPETIKT